MSLDVKDITQQLEIRYKGIYNLDGLYKMMRSWLDAQRYDYMEKRYKDKVGGPFGNELEIEMRPELKVTEFIKFHIEVDTHMWEVKEFEAEIDGQKKLVTDGRFFIKLRCWIEFDYQGRFKTDFQKALLKFMITKVLKRYFEIKWYDRLKYDLYKFHAEIKKFLKCETEFNAY